MKSLDIEFSLTLLRLYLKIYPKASVGDYARYMKRKLL